jgi:hypothetical protein
MGMTGNGAATTSITTAGGEASTAMATGGGSTKTATVKGGNSGNAPVAAGSGGFGVDGTAFATADTMGTGPTYSATAIGGSAGDGGNAPANPKDPLQPTFGGNCGFGGDGGGAMATATTANGTSATATATVGNGGFAGRGGSSHQVPAKQAGTLLSVGGPGDDSVAGAGGHAVVDATSTNTAGNTTAISNATGGNGGVLGPAGVAVIGKPGSALATAAGNATADPTATIGKSTGGIAVAVGNATGNGGKTTDNGLGISDGKTRKVNGRAIANIPAGAMGNLQGQGQAAIAASLPALTPNTTLNAFGSAIAQPLISDVLGTSATAPDVVSALEVGRPDDDQLGLVSLGGLYPEGGWRPHPFHRIGGLELRPDATPRGVSAGRPAERPGDRKGV